MRMTRWLLGCVCTAMICLLGAPGGPGQTVVSPSPSGAAGASKAGTEIPIERCDHLPVVVVKVDNEDRRFLVDTAATSFLNAKSFAGKRTKAVRIQSWNQTTAIDASDISIGELALGSHVIRNVDLPAIDLSAISKACGGQLDGVLGVDLLERLGVTIDLERSVALLGATPPDLPEMDAIAEMEKAIDSCAADFNNADADKLAACFDPDFELSSPGGELHGREQAQNYFRQYFDASPHAHLAMKLSDQRVVGETVWALYDYTIESASRHRSGRGMMLCRKSENRWYILSMHDSPFVASAATDR